MASSVSTGYEASAFKVERGPRAAWIRWVALGLITTGFLLLTFIMASGGLRILP